MSKQRRRYKIQAWYAIQKSKRTVTESICELPDDTGPRYSSASRELQSFESEFINAISSTSSTDGCQPVNRSIQEGAGPAPWHHRSTFVT